MTLRIAYVSELAESVSRTDLDGIVRHSAEANEARGVTGVLGVEGARVCQILEGPEEEVTRLFERIRADARHHHVVEIDRRAVAAPHFGRWGMVRRSMVDMLMLALTQP
ncbi:hypothetical protein GCM10011390_16620 [Aureimonas endophytica]|uniref:BLUF domain-containing protein n=1 Tax=Aureimonas endophytica TaxID=2027858 RepID=A0A916ZI65_9HYPH|nr:BLUF domain-containing protein [Aureimonas endophytica]GGD98508.1 hypothetical protein GCM10011390_16620 [Aureimonas endophytica]